MCFGCVCPLIATTVSIILSGKSPVKDFYPEYAIFGSGFATKLLQNIKDKFMKIYSKSVAVVFVK